MVILLIILLVILLVVGLTVLLIIWLVVALVVVWLVISPSAELIRHVGTMCGLGFRDKQKGIKKQ